MCLLASICLCFYSRTYTWEWTIWLRPILAALTIPAILTIMFGISYIGIEKRVSELFNKYPEIYIIETENTFYVVPFKVDKLPITVQVNKSDAVTADVSIKEYKSIVKADVTKFIFLLIGEPCEMDYRLNKVIKQ